MYELFPDGHVNLLEEGKQEDYWTSAFQIMSPTTGGDFEINPVLNPMGSVGRTIVCFSYSSGGLLCSHLAGKHPDPN